MVSVNSVIYLSGPEGLSKMSLLEGLHFSGFSQYQVNWYGALGAELQTSTDLVRWRGVSTSDLIFSYDRSQNRQFFRLIPGSP